MFLSLSLSFQPWLLQKPHRFLRDPLLRSVPACGGGLDHTVHNRIRPDVWLRLPAGVEEEEGGWGESSVTWLKEVTLPFPPPAPWSSYRSDAVLGSVCLFLDHLSVTDQKTLGKKRISQDEHAVSGGTPHQHPALSRRPPPPPLLLLLLLFYDIGLHYCTSTAMNPSTSSLLLSPLDSLLLPGTNGEERG